MVSAVEPLGDGAWTALDGCHIHSGLARGLRRVVECTLAEPVGEARRGSCSEGYPIELRNINYSRPRDAGWMPGGSNELRVSGGNMTTLTTYLHVYSANCFAG